MKQIVYDYFAAFHWERLKKAFSNMNWWIYLYLGFALPAITIDQEDGTFFAYTMLAFPILYCFLSGSIHPLKPPKIMFLCPMNLQDRKTYAIKFWLFKISIIIFLGLLGILILLSQKRIDIVSAGVALCNIIILSLFFSGFVEKSPYAQKNPNPYNKADSPIEICGTLAAIFSSFSIAFLLCQDTPVASWVKWIFVAFLILVELPLTVVFMKRWRNALNNSLSYEQCYL